MKTLCASEVRLSPSARDSGASAILTTGRLCFRSHLPAAGPQDIGAAGTPLLRSTYAAFENGHDTPAGASRPSPREISNSVLFADTQPDVVNDRDLSSLAYTWGQFVDHDLTLVRTVDEAFDIPVPMVRVALLISESPRPRQKTCLTAHSIPI